MTNIKMKDSVDINMRRHIKADGVARQHCSDCTHILWDSGSEQILLLFMVIMGILGCTGSSGAQVRALGLPQLFLKLTLTSLGYKPCRTPATTISGRSGGNDHNRTFHLGVKKIHFCNDIITVICKVYLIWIQAGKGQPRNQLLADWIT